MEKTKWIGFACSYTPLAVIHAAGFTPYRVLPDDKSPDQAGRILHDNLCPHVKRILDRAAAGNLPELEAMLIMNSCDAMRRLYDAWQKTCPQIPAILVDLPVTSSQNAIDFFRDQLERVTGVLENLGDTGINPERIENSIALYNEMAGYFSQLREKNRRGGMKNGAVVLQGLYNRASVEPPEEMIAELAGLLSEPDENLSSDALPVYLFGNVLTDPAAFSLFESCGARIIAEDMCTGSRLFTEIPLEATGDFLADYAGGLLGRRPCARTFDASEPGLLGRVIVEAAKHNGACGVIGYTVKFCDPYVARLPEIRDALKHEGLPFLFLEGDCTMNTIGQQKTRIEAFIEMLR